MWEVSGGADLELETRGRLLLPCYNDILLFLALVSLDRGSLTEGSWYRDLQVGTRGYNGMSRLSPIENASVGKYERID